MATPATSAMATKPRRVRTALLFGLLGFLLGALFWHFVGFWDFVGQVMFRGKAGAEQINHAPPPIRLKDRVSGVQPSTAMLESDWCTTLQLDRLTGVTLAVPCDAVALPLRSLKAAKREDLWVTAVQRQYQATSRGWATVTVEPPGQRVSEATDD